MVIEKINPDKLHKPIDNLYAHIVKASGNITYRIGGQVALNRDGKNCLIDDMAGQIRYCYDQVTWALESVGLTWKDVVHIYTFTTDMDEYMKYELSIVKEYFDDDPPASTLIEVKRLVDPAWLIEVQIDAVGENY